MRRNRKSITTSPEIVTNIAELSKMNFNLLIKLVHWMDANEKAQRKFRYAVIGSLSKIEATASLLLVDQMAQTQRLKLYDSDKLEEDAKAAEDFISKQLLEKGVAVVKYIYTETTPETAVYDRRRKWTGWEI
jgi:hypothetical protein